jgi:hypothetical protein
MNTATLLWFLRVGFGIAGVQVFRLGRERGQREIVVGGILLLATPWFFQTLPSLLLFESGIALPVALMLRKSMKP